MATVQEPTRAAGRHESFVAAQIDRATRRIRGHDLGIATLGFLFKEADGVCDRQWELYQQRYD